MKPNSLLPLLIVKYCEGKPMRNRFVRNARDAARKLVLAMSSKIVVGEKPYDIDGLYRNKLQLAATNKEHYEAWSDAVFGTVLSLRDGAFIDVGANVGQTLITVLSIDPERQYIGFEPQISGSFYIDQFITRNKLRNHVILPIGMGEKRGVAKLGLRESEDVTASMIEEYRPEDFYSYYAYIPVFPGDEIIPTFKLDSISLLKVDVEGGELEVIRGFANSIKKYKPYIVFEVLPNFLFATGQPLDEETRNARHQRHIKTDREIRAHGYVIFQIRPGGNLVKVDGLQADERLVMNHLAVPEEEETRFLAAYAGNS
jgi:FkbM family methyltransferase